MTYLLITGIIFVVVPALVIEGFALFILFSFMKDDSDANNVFKLALLALVFGLILLGVYFVETKFIL